MTYQKILGTGLCLVVFCFCGAFQAVAKDSFSDWLESFQAYDVLESELSQKNPSPETILHRAKLLLQARNPDKALEILDRFGSFPDKAQEARRIWTKARILRARNKPLPALFAYSKGAGLMTEDERVEAFQSEPDLDFFWKTTLRKWIFEHLYNGRIQVNEGQKQLLLQASAQARAVWDQDDFWATLQAALSGEKTRLDQGRPASVLEVDPRSKQMVVQTLAGLAIQDVHFIRNNLEKIVQPEVRQLWTRVLSAVLGRNLDPIQAEVLDLKSGYPKFGSFQEVFLSQPQRMNSKAWQIGRPEMGSWQAFTERLENSSLEQALGIIENEFNSVLLSKEIKGILEQYLFSYAVITERTDLAQEVWSRLEITGLPLSLKLCGVLSGLGSIAGCFAEEEHWKTEKLLLSILAGATGQTPATDLQLPFWIRLDGSRSLFETQKSHSLDMLLAYAVQRHKWQSEPTVFLAKENALLFPETTLGSKALLYLARKAYDRGQTRMAWEYLQTMQPQMLSSREKVEYFQAKGGLLMDLGQVDDSIETYQQLLNTYPRGLTPEKKLKLALLSQRRGNWKWAQELLQDLWEEHRSLEPSLQAEIMFWLGEGAQKSGNDLEALKHYLRLAWEFPGEHIWAVTALYRSALIYEQKGQFTAARNLLERVVKKADRKSQKEAAQDRIKAIDDRLRRDQGQESETTFLF